MSDSTPHLKSSRRDRWFKNIFVAWDFYCGLGAGLAAYFLLTQYPSLVTEARGILTTEIFLGAGILGVVLAALAITISVIGDHYLHVLQGVTDGVSGALRPYQVVAAVGGASAVVALGTLLVWDELGATSRAVLFAVATGSTVWAICGTYSLIGLTIFHATKRAELQRAVEQKKLELIRDRRSA